MTSYKIKQFIFLIMTVYCILHSGY